MGPQIEGFHLQAANALPRAGKAFAVCVHKVQEALFYIFLLLLFFSKVIWKMFSAF